MWHQIPHWYVVNITQAPILFINMVTKYKGFYEKNKNLPCDQHGKKFDVVTVRRSISEVPLYVARWNADGN